MHAQLSAIYWKKIFTDTTKKNVLVWIMQAETVEELNIPNVCIFQTIQYLNSPPATIRHGRFIVIKKLGYVI